MLFPSIQGHIWSLSDTAIRKSAPGWAGVLGLTLQRKDLALRAAAPLSVCGRRGTESDQPMAVSVIPGPTRNSSLLTFLYSVLLRILVTVLIIKGLLTMC
jgi:hypothetical protein